MTKRIEEQKEEAMKNALSEIVLNWETEESRAIISPCGVMFLPDHIKGSGINNYVVFKSTCGKFTMEPAFDTGWMIGETRVNLSSETGAISNVTLRQADEWLLSHRR